MKTSTYNRNHFGALSFSGKPPTNLSNGLKLLEKAISLKLLDYEYIDTDKKGFGDCLNYDIYDVARGSVLVQRRETTIDKYGNHPQKDYFIISDSGKTVTPVAHKSMIVKWSKRAKKPGDIIKADTGLIKIDLSNPVEYGFKAVTRNTSGHYISVWDKSAWSLGKQRTEKASNDHTGGFYYYPSLKELEAGIYGNDIFGAARSHNNLFVLRVKIEGARYQVYNSKHCASKITPISLVK